MRLPAPDFWHGRRVLVTGNTGFKGSWLCLWLQRLGAEVHGLSLLPPSEPSMYEVASVAEVMATSVVTDVRNRQAVEEHMNHVHPELVFHLAAQPLVRRSYEVPLETYEVNVLGLAYVLDAVRVCRTVRAVVIVTSDKCYENRDWLWSYRENDGLGGDDPYSSSKGCAELITAAYRRSFFGRLGIGLATARAGNVVGGGDWAADRLIPDALRAVQSNFVMNVRNPDAIRPWQHVLEPVLGYLLLAEDLYRDPVGYAEAWNFGPFDEDTQHVRTVLGHVSAQHPNFQWRQDEAPTAHEARVLKLDSSKARALLGWAPRWRLEKAIHMTSAWHRAWSEGQDMNRYTQAQIQAYCSYP